MDKKTNPYVGHRYSTEIICHALWLYEYANTLRRRQPKRGDKWHLDEVVLTLKGKHHYLWHAMGQDGHTLDILVQSRRQQIGGINRQFPNILIGDSSNVMLHT